jgi:hypothetical protein
LYAQHDNEPVVITRDVDAVIVPAGVNVKLREGQQGFITQALGGSFTVYVEGNLFRIAGEDADALGKEPEAVPELPPDANDDDVRRLAWEQMRNCYDPEIPINIVDLGLVYDCDVTVEEDGGRVVRQDDADRAGLRHGRGAGRRRSREGRDHPDGQARGRRSGVRSAVEPVDDVRRGTAADGNDVSAAPGHHA